MMNRFRLLAAAVTV